MPLIPSRARFSEHRMCQLSLTSHTKEVTAIKWGGDGLLYSSSRDTSILVWETTEGKLVRSLKGHGHWVNTLALSSEYALRTGAFDHTGTAPKGAEEARAHRRRNLLFVFLGITSHVTMLFTLCVHEAAPDVLEPRHRRRLKHRP